MAASRVRRLGTIFSRTQGLIRSGAMRREKIPVWYNVYEAFPPLDKFDVEANEPDTAKKLRRVIYPEDLIRMKFYDKYGTPEVINLESNVETLSQKFAKFYIAKKSSLLTEKQRLPKDEATEDRLASAAKGEATEDRLASAAKGEATEDRLATDAKGEATEDRLATDAKGEATEDRLATDAKGEATEDRLATDAKGEATEDITIEDILKVFAHEHSLKMSEADVKRQRRKRRRESIQMRTLKKRKPVPADPVAVLGTWEELERL